jgi:hypothetical protein
MRKRLLILIALIAFELIAAVTCLRPTIFSWDLRQASRKWKENPSAESKATLDRERGIVRKMLDDASKGSFMLLAVPTIVVFLVLELKRRFRNQE